MGRRREGGGGREVGRKDRLGILRGGGEREVGRRWRERSGKEVEGEKWEGGGGREVGSRDRRMLKGWR